MQSFKCSIFPNFEFTTSVALRNVLYLHHMTTPLMKGKQTTLVNFGLAHPKIIILMITLFTCTLQHSYPLLRNFV